MKASGLACKTDASIFNTDPESLSSESGNNNCKLSQVVSVNTAFKDVSSLCCDLIISVLWCNEVGRDPRKYDAVSRIS